MGPESFLSSTVPESAVVVISLTATDLPDKGRRLKVLVHRFDFTRLDVKFSRCTSSTFMIATNRNDTTDMRDVNVMCRCV